MVSEQKQKINASCCILAGGKSHRFGSDKVLLEIEGKLVIREIYERMRSIFKDVFIVADTIDRFSTDEFKIYTDIYKNKGPLGGIHCALVNSKYEKCFITACDLPNINSEIIRILWRNTKKYNAIVPLWNSNTEPLAAFYHKNCIPAIIKNIDSDQFAVRGIFPLVNTKFVDLTDQFSKNLLVKIFSNINLPGDIEKINI